MSALILPKAHIDALVTAWRIVHNADLAEGDRVGTLLTAENYRSYNVRYRTSLIPPAYQAPIVSRVFDGVSPAIVAQLLKACDAYVYMACETTDWEETEAIKTVRYLRDALRPYLPGYEPAAWIVDFDVFAEIAHVSRFPRGA